MDEAMNRKMIPGERWTGVPDGGTVERLHELTPYVRQSGDDWRPPWFLKERKLLDYLAVFIGGGEGVFSVGGREFRINAGELAWIPPDTVHEMRGTSSLMNCIYIHFDLIYDPQRSHWDACIPGGTQDLSDCSMLMHPPITDPVISTWKGKIPLSNPQLVRLLFKQICLEHRRGGANCSHMLLRGLMLQLLHEIMLQTIPDEQSGRHVNMMQEAAGAILDAPGAGKSIGDISRSFGLSTSHFRRVFKEVHGISPCAMHNREKMAKACERLVYTGMTIKEIAAELNYSNVHNFTRAFKSWMSVTPGKYRSSR